MESKETLSAMTPAPWLWQEFSSHGPNEEPQGTTIMDRGGYYICHQLNIRPIEKRQDIATKIVSAVNATYGSGIDPLAVKDLIDALVSLSSLVDCYTEDLTNAVNSAKAAISKATLKPNNNG